MRYAPLFLCTYVRFIAYLVAMKIGSVLLFLLAFVFQVNAQVQAVKVTALPSSLAESSGLLLTAPGRFMSHNDSGNEPLLIEFDSTSTTLRTIRLNAPNIDWEEITQDASGKVYIGEFGNNGNARKDLKIYILNKPSTLLRDTVNAAVINFSYSDQKAFPPAMATMNYDMEAMVAMNDSLYLFSKNRTDPYSGFTYLYQLPAKAGTFTALKRDSFYTGPGPWANYSVTAAALSPDKKTLMLSGYERCWVFRNFQAANFFKGDAYSYTFPTFLQREGIVLMDNYSGYFTDESTPLTTASLYRFTLPGLVNSISEPASNFVITVFPNPADGYIEFSQPIEKTAIFKLFSPSGKLILQERFLEDIVRLPLPSGKLSAGVYLLSVSIPDGREIRKTIVVK